MSSGPSMRILHWLIASCASPGLNALSVMPSCLITCLTADTWSRSSQMVKLEGRSAAACSRRKMRAHSEWKVAICSWCGFTSPSSAATRRFISSAALFVKVAAKTSPGATPRERTRCAMRRVITRVFPLPAPATISTGPSGAVTASSCCGLRFCRMGSSEVIALHKYRSAAQRMQPCESRRAVVRQPRLPPPAPPAHSDSHSDSDSHSHSYSVPHPRSLALAPHPFLARRQTSSISPTGTSHRSRPVSWA